MFFHTCNFRPQPFQPFTGGWVGGEDRRRCQMLVCSQFFIKAEHAVRVDAGSDQPPQSFIVGLPLGIAGKAQFGEAGSGIGKDTARSIADHQ